MALLACKECKREISSDAKVCPHCGKRQRTNTRVALLAALISVLVLLGCLGVIVNQFNTRGPTVDTGSASTVGHVTPAQPVWNYSSQVDKMGRGTTEFASLDSVNQVSFDFPYNGGSTASLVIRNSPKYGKDVLLEIDKGQFLCDTEDCHVNVRVDNGPAARVDGDESSDGSSNVIFLPYSTLVRDLLRAKVLRVEPNFYQEGSRVFEFHPHGLDMKRLRSTKD